MRDLNRGRYGTFTTRTRKEQAERQQEENDKTRNGPVVTYLKPDITITQYMNWLMTLTEQQLHDHLYQEEDPFAERQDEAA